jgi:hypothetical protein
MLEAIAADTIETVDGAAIANKTRRNDLFHISGIKGNYLQVFVAQGHRTICVGNFQAIKSLNDSGELSKFLQQTTKCEEANSNTEAPHWQN